MTGLRHSTQDHHGFRTTVDSQCCSNSYRLLRKIAVFERKTLNILPDPQKVQLQSPPPAPAIMKDPNTSPQVEAQNTGSTVQPESPPLENTTQDEFLIQDESCIIRK
ncbi:hypothetical protein MHYP_G00219920 [Metynnis hypsauchen]